MGWDYVPDYFLAGASNFLESQEIETYAQNSRKISFWKSNQNKQQCVYDSRKCFASYIPNYHVLRQLTPFPMPDIDVI